MDNIIRTAEEVIVVAGPGTELGRMMQRALETPEERHAREQRMEHDYFERATKIDAKDYEGWVSWPGHGDDGDGFFESVNELIRWCADHEVNGPLFVWACTREPFKLDVDTILDDALQEHFNGARGEIPEAEEKRLQAFLDEWADAQKIVSWHEDRTRAIMLPKGDVIAAPGPREPIPLYVATLVGRK